MTGLPLSTGIHSAGPGAAPNCSFARPWQFGIAGVDCHQWDDRWAEPGRWPL